MGLDLEHVRQWVQLAPDGKKTVFAGPRMVLQVCAETINALNDGRNAAAGNWPAFCNYTAACTTLNLEFEIFGALDELDRIAANIPVTPGREKFQALAALIMREIRAEAVPIPPADFSRAMKAAQMSVPDTWLKTADVVVTKLTDAGDLLTRLSGQEDFAPAVRLRMASYARDFCRIALNHIAWSEQNHYPPADAWYIYSLLHKAADGEQRARDALRAIQ